MAAPAIFTRLALIVTDSGDWLIEEITPFLETLDSILSALTEIDASAAITRSMVYKDVI